MSHTVKLDTYQPSQKPSEDYCQVLRDLAVQAVFAYWHERHKPIHIRLVEKKVLHELWRRKVRRRWLGPYPSKRTIERRIQEAATKEHGAKIVNVTAGYYRPNPNLFEKKEI